jgi:diaminopimelate epimerase
MHFTKMHGLGNDFILLEGLDESRHDLGQLAVKLCDRHLGVGADGIMVVLPSIIADVRMRIINSDGSEAAMCGNGIRCFAKYVFEQGIVAKERFAVETLAGPIKPELMIKDSKVAAVRVDMGQPNFERHEIPMTGPTGAVVNESLRVKDQEYRITSMLMGVPHTIIFVDDLDQVDLPVLGPAVERHPVFPKKTNVNFVQVLSDREIKVRTWERGAGRTLACGTGSCASTVAAARNGRTGREVTVHLELGDLFIQWTEAGTVFMTGPATEVFQGEIVVE